LHSGAPKLAWLSNRHCEDPGEWWKAAIRASFGFDTWSHNVNRCAHGIVDVRRSKDSRQECEREFRDAAFRFGKSRNGKVVQGPTKAGSRPGDSRGRLIPRDLCLSIASASGRLARLAVWRSGAARLVWRRRASSRVAGRQRPGVRRWPALPPFCGRPS